MFPFSTVENKSLSKDFQRLQMHRFQVICYFPGTVNSWTLLWTFKEQAKTQTNQLALTDVGPNVNLFHVWISTHFLSVKMPEKTDKSLSVFFFFWLPFEIAGGLTIPQMNSTFHVKMIYSRQICYTGLHCFIETSHVFKNWNLFWKRGSPLVRCFTFNSVKHKIIEGVFRWKRFKRGLSLWIY